LCSKNRVSDLQLLAFVWKPRITGSDPNIRIPLSMCSEHRISDLEVVGVVWKPRLKPERVLEDKMGFVEKPR